MALIGAKDDDRIIVLEKGLQFLDVAKSGRRSKCGGAL